MMKSLKHYSFMLLTLCFMLVTSMKCKKDYIEKNELPPITQTGANTFGCYVNGEIFLPRGGTLKSAISINKNFNSFYISIIDGYNVARSVTLKFNATTTSNTLECISHYNNSCSYQSCPPITYNFKILKLDEANKIIAGQFNAILPATATCPEVKITEGRFDLKYTEN